MNNDPKKMENSELIANFLISRDNLVALRRASIDNPLNENLILMFDVEQKKYTELLLEVYRRMQ